MLRPEQMSRVSVTGSKRVMDDVVDAVHDLHALHVTEYDNTWDAFDPGEPGETAEDASEKLVTVRSLQSILDVDEDDAGPSRLVTDESLAEELEEIRVEVNELDDRRDDLEDELRAVEEQIDAMEPFVTLDVDLDLLRGYDSLTVSVGEGDDDDVRAALASSEIDEYELFVEDDVVAVFARCDRETLDDVLVGAAFTELEVPEGDGDPSQYLDELTHRREQLEAELSTVEDELEDVKLDAAGFLLAAEEELTIEVQKSEAPLSFATTENAFVAEGWLPTDQFAEFAETLKAEVGDAIAVDELERADYDDQGHAHGSEAVPGHEDADDVPESGGASGRGVAEAEADAEESEGEPQEAAADGGVVTMNERGPPTQQDNEGPAEPFELLTRMVGLPSYEELDPTFVLMLTFPVFFGFMIGDFGYGVLYTLAGYAMVSRFDSDAIRSLGGIGMWAGAFTMLFGVLYGEVFGMHVLGDIVWGGSPPMHKGLQPVHAASGQTWLLVSLLAGLAHLTLGYFFGAINDAKQHGVVDAIFEDFSWLAMMIGLWLWILSTQAEGSKPDLLFEVLGSGEEAVYQLGFTGFSPMVGTVGLGLFVVGLGLMTYAEFTHMGAPGLLVGPLESVNVLVNVLSYLRIGAVLLAKAGMAFVVNLLFWGVYVVETGHGAEWHFGTSHSPQYYLEHGYHGHEVAEVMFPGLVHGGIGMALIGVVIFVVGHITVLLLGITSAGLQGIRLEYVEFFDKFYEGDGYEFDPFGYDRQHTTED